MPSAQSCEVADFLTPIAILGGAIVAALYARFNHKEQLDDANHRLARELEHDRTIRDHDEARRDVKEAVAALAGSIKLAGDHASKRALSTDANAAYEEHAATRPPEDSDDPTWAEAHLENAKRRAEAHDELARVAKEQEDNRLVTMGLETRLALRFADDHAISIAYERARNALEQWEAAIVTDGGDEASEERAHAFALLKFKELQETCRAWARSHLVAAGPSEE